jgi:cyclin-dependent kinase 9
MGKKSKTIPYVLSILLIRFRVVYKARCKNTKGLVALKHILIPKEEEGFPRSALREIGILQTLNHENIVQLIRMCRSSSKFDVV